MASFVATVCVVLHLILLPFPLGQASMARVASPGGVTTLSTTMTCLGKCPPTYRHPPCPRCPNTQLQRASVLSCPAQPPPQLLVPPPPPPLCQQQPNPSPTLTRHCPAKVLPHLCNPNLAEGTFFLFSVSTVVSVFSAWCCSYSSLM